MEISKQLDYQKKSFTHPQYKFNQLWPNTGGVVQTVSTVGGQETIFEIPVNAVNLSRSYLSFQASIPATVAAHYHNVYADCISFFQQVQFYTKSGVYPVDLNYANNYTKIVLNAETKLDEFLTYDVQITAGDAAGVATADPAVIGSGAMFFRNNALGGGGATVPAVAPRPTKTTTGSKLSYTEPAYILDRIGAAGAAVIVSQVATFNVRIDLGKFKNTVLALDKDLFFGEIMALRFVWAPGVKIAFTGTHAIGNIDTAAAALAVDVNISRLALYVAVEKNQDIVNQLRAQAATEGINVLIPYVYGYKTNLGGGSQVVSLRLNRGHGRKLRKIYHSLFNNAETSNTAYDHNNINGVKCTSYYTMLNNERLQDADLAPTRLDDWNYHKESLRGSVLQDYNVYQYNFFHRDQFSGEYSIKDDMSNLETGLDLNMEQKWDIYLTVVAANYNHYTYAITEKMLSVGPSGITVL